MGKTFQTVYRDAVDGIIVSLISNSLENSACISLYIMLQCIKKVEVCKLVQTHVFPSALESNKECIAGRNVSVALAMLWANGEFVYCIIFRSVLKKHGSSLNVIY